MKSIGASVAMTIAVSAPAASALEPISGPDNFEGVCNYLERIAATSEKIVKNSGSIGELINEYSFELYALAFSAETRATVDADDLDELFFVGERVLFMSNTLDHDRRRGEIRPAIDEFGAKYHCSIDWDKI